MFWICTPPWTHSPLLLNLSISTVCFLLTLCYNIPSSRRASHRLGERIQGKEPSV